MTLTYDTGLPMLTAAQYATANKIAERTVKRWLADGELPGAIKDERGRWLIPTEAERTTADVVTLPRPMTRATTDVMVSHPSHATLAAGPGPLLDTLPSFLTIEQTAQILGVSRHAIITHRDYFGVVPFGANGSLVVPLATIKRIRG